MAKHVGKLWSKTEEDELRDEYVVKNISIDEIASLHKRFRGGILSRLKKLNLLRECDESLYEQSKKEKEEKNNEKKEKSDKEDEKSNEKDMINRIVYLEDKVKFLENLVNEMREMRKKNEFII